jgi:hypothetical protein
MNSRGWTISESLEDYAAVRDLIADLVAEGVDATVKPDPIVKPFNGEDIIRQWTNVHGLSDSPSYQELIGSHTRRIWNDATGKTLIEAFSIRLRAGSGRDGPGCAVQIPLSSQRP